MNQAKIIPLSQQLTSAQINEGPQIESSSSSNSKQLSNQKLISSALEEKKESSNIQESFSPTIPAANILTIEGNPF